MTKPISMVQFIHENMPEELKSAVLAMTIEALGKVSRGECPAPPASSDKTILRMFSLLAAEIYEDVIVEKMQEQCVDAAVDNSDMKDAAAVLSKVMRGSK
jgi:hypothetical protein